MLELSVTILGVHLQRREHGLVLIHPWTSLLASLNVVGFIKYLSQITFAIVLEVICVVDLVNQRLFAPSARIFVVAQLSLDRWDLTL